MMGKDARVLIDESKIALPRPIAFKKVEPKVVELKKDLAASSAYTDNEQKETALVTESFIFPYMNGTGTDVVNVRILGIDDKPVLTFNSAALSMNAMDTKDFVPSVIIPEGKSVTIQAQNTSAGTVSSFIVQLWGLRLER